MTFAAKKKPEPSELEILDQAQAVAMQVIDRKVKELKASHPSLPEVTLRMDLMRGSNNVFAVAKYILEQGN